MKYLKYFEAVRKNPLEDYLWDLLDYGFEYAPNKHLNNGDIKLTFKGKYDDIEVVKMYSDLKQGLSKAFKIISYGLVMRVDRVDIEFTRKIEDYSDEVELSEKQKVAFDALSKCVELIFIGKDYYLFVNEVHDNGSIDIGITSKDVYSFNGKVFHVDSRGCLTDLKKYLKMRSVDKQQSKVCNLPFNDLDIKWFVKFTNFNRSFEFMSKIDFEEYKKMSDLPQKELRELYK